ncbi:hypothetical protein [Nostoc sp.]|uniref:hypothetical protein n=1 Tax=Nostoc sp. TaxID=1180 RepID=UPI002FFAF1C2
MKVEFRKSFEKALEKIQDSNLLAKIKAVIEEKLLKQEYKKRFSCTEVPPTKPMRRQQRLGLIGNLKPWTLT